VLSTRLPPKTRIAGGWGQPLTFSFC